MENTEGISCISVSTSKKFLVICEKATKAVWTVYEIQNQKVRRSLLKGDQEASSSYQSKEFVSCSFSPKNEKHYLITLTGEPDWLLILWKWDSSKICALINIGLQGPLMGPSLFKCSFNPFDNNAVVVTGTNIYKYYKVKDLNEFVADHTQLNNKDRQISTQYSCHAWMQDTGRLIVCTENGEIMLCETSGEFMNFIHESPGEGYRITTIVPFSRGFIISGENGMISAYERVEDPKYPYRRTKNIECRLDQTQQYQLTAFPISSMCLTSTEDQLFFITDNMQLIKTNIALDGTDDVSKFDYVVCNFHSDVVTGLDLCIRKTLIVTCSKDKTVRIWNYATRTLEIVHQVPEQALSVAFHPSGFHVIIGLDDKILMMNVLSKSLNQIKQIQIKSCREIRFASGGHLFAAAYLNNAVYVYNFYTGECPTYYQCKGHTHKVRSIDWFEDDMGFASCDTNGNVYFFDLIAQKDTQTRLSDKDFN